MARFSKLLFGAAALCLSVRAQGVSYCPVTGICYNVTVPQSTVSASGDGDVFMQLTAPSSYEWVALGMGSQMAGSYIFLMYADGAGNVTISPRLGTGHVMPEYNSAATLTLLEGSGVASDVMTANVRCSGSGCGETLDVTSTSSNWIAAWKSGAPLDSTSLSEPISKHDSHSQFQFDLTQAVIATDANPYVASSSSTGGSTPTTPSPPSSSSNSGSSGGEVAANPAPFQKAHGVIMAVTAVLLLPFGALYMRVLGGIWVHAGFQIFSVLCLFAGLGLGVHLARITDGLYNNTHTILGTVVVSLFVLQPVGGMLHHRQYVKTGRPTAAGRGHVWFGRVLIMLAIINGGIGLRLAANTTSGEIAYGVIAGVVGVVYVATVVAKELQTRKRARNDGAVQAEKRGNSA